MKPLTTPLPRRFRAMGLLLAVAVPFAAQAQEQATSAESSAKKPAVDPVEWKAQSKAGFVMSGGNSQATNATFGLNGSRKEGNNKLTLEGAYAYGKSRNLYAVVDPNATDPNEIYGLGRRSVTSTDNWQVKGRYDRFITDNNTLYGSGQGAGDKVAGKQFFGGVQLGYSRQLWKDDMHLVVAELGYDFSYERYESRNGVRPDGVTIHSARALVGETLTLTKLTGLTASVECLFNLNKETKAQDASDGSTGVDAFKDTRINAKLGINSALWKSLSMGFGFTLKYDQNPAPRSLPSGTPSEYTFPTAYASYKYANKVDTMVEATLLYTFF